MTTLVQDQSHQLSLGHFNRLPDPQNLISLRSIGFDHQYDPVYVWGQHSGLV
jgi:hypothetical protein